jgi:hypothetical protein
VYSYYRACCRLPPVTAYFRAIINVLFFIYTFSASPSAESKKKKDEPEPEGEEVVEEEIAGDDDDVGKEESKEEKKVKEKKEKRVEKEKEKQEKDEYSRALLKLECCFCDIRCVSFKVGKLACTLSSCMFLFLCATKGFSIYRFYYYAV